MMIISLLCFALAASPEILQADYPDLYEERLQLQPRATRAGHLRFVGSDLADPEWTPLYVHRYLHKNESTQVRRALLDLIYRSEGALPQEINDTFSEAPALLQVSMVDMNPYLPAIAEQINLSSAPQVQAALLRQLAKDQQTPTSFVYEALTSSDPVILRDACRVAYMRKLTDTLPLLGALFTHNDPHVLLNALYAISKIDQEQARRIVRKYNLTEHSFKNLAYFSQGLL